MSSHIVSRTHLANGYLVSTVRLPEGDYETLVFPFNAATIEIDGMTHIDTLQEAVAFHAEMVERHGGAATE